MPQAESIASKGWREEINTRRLGRCSGLRPAFKEFVRPPCIDKTSIADTTPPCYRMHARPQRPLLPSA